MRRRLITFASGQQTFVTDDPESRFNIEVEVDDDRVIKDEIIDLPDEEIKKAEKNLKTHEAKFDIITKQITFQKRKKVKE